MKIRLSLIVSAIAVVSLTCVSFAQGGGQGGNGAGRGQGRQPGMGRGMRNMTMNLTSLYIPLLDRTDVQEDLKVTDEQKTKISDLRKKQREDMMKLFQSGSFNPNATEEEQKAARDKMQKDMEKLNESTMKDLNAIFNETQQKRIKEIALQISKNNALGLTDIQKELKITDKQKTDMDALRTKMGEANRSVYEKARNQEITQEDAQKLVKKNQEALEAEYAKLLTADQAKKLKEMQGTTPFKADKKYENWNPFGMGRMGGPGGGRGGAGGGAGGNGGGRGGAGGGN